MQFRICVQDLRSICHNLYVMRQFFAVITTYHEIRERPEYYRCPLALNRWRKMAAIVWIWAVRWYKCAGSLCMWKVFVFLPLCWPLTCAVSASFSLSGRRRPHLPVWDAQCTTQLRRRHLCGQLQGWNRPQWCHQTLDRQKKCVWKA